MNREDFISLQDDDECEVWFRFSDISSFRPDECVVHFKNGDELYLSDNGVAKLVKILKGSQ